MEGVGRMLNPKFIQKTLKLLSVVPGSRLVHSNTVPLASTGSILRNCCNRPNNWFPNFKTCGNTPLSGNIRYFCISKVRPSEDDSEELAKKGKHQDLLQNDAELQNYLKDIMHDFNDSGPPNSPPKTKRLVDENEEKSLNSKPCEACGGESKNLPHSIEGRFNVFDESQTEEILDFDEEQQQDENFYLYQEKEDPLKKYDCKRGKECVIDIDELVTVLHQENAADLVVLSVPEHLHYCSYLVLVTAKSPRHVKALEEFIRKLYKKKKAVSDSFIITEGKSSSDWKVLDMGQIVLHIFLEATRSHYDLETLWTVGEQYDDLSNVKEDVVLDLLQQHVQYLDEIEPLSVSEKQ